MDTVVISYEKQLYEELRKYHDDVAVRISSKISSLERRYKNKEKDINYKICIKRYNQERVINQLAKDLVSRLRFDVPKLNLSFELRENLEILLTFLNSKEISEIKDALYYNLRNELKQFSAEARENLSKILKAKSGVLFASHYLYGKYISERKEIRKKLEQYCNIMLSKNNTLSNLEYRNVTVNSAELNKLDQLIKAGKMKNKYVINNYEKIKVACQSIANLEYVNSVIDNILKLEGSGSKIDWIRLKKVLTKIKRKNENIIAMQRRFLDTINFYKVEVEYESLSVLEELSSSLSDEKKYEIIRKLAVKNLYIKKKISSNIYKLYVDNKYTIDISKVSDKNQLKIIKKTELLIMSEIADLIKTYQLHLNLSNVDNQNVMDVNGKKRS